MSDVKEENVDSDNKTLFEKLEYIPKFLAIATASITVLSFISSDFARYVRGYSAEIWGHKGFVRYEVDEAGFPNNSSGKPKLILLKEGEKDRANIEFGDRLRAISVQNFRKSAYFEDCRSDNRDKCSPKTFRLQENDCVIVVDTLPTINKERNEGRLSAALKVATGPCGIFD